MLASLADEESTGDAAEHDHLWVQGGPLLLIWMHHLMHRVKRCPSAGTEIAGWAHLIGIVVEQPIGQGPQHLPGI